MAKRGFRRGKYNPCLYHHPKTGLVCMVHGDDFVSTGNVQAAQEFREKLESRFEIKTQLLGAEGVVMHARTITTPETVQQEGRVLNRVVRWTNDGWEVEPDQRHADLIVQEMGMQEAKPASTPGESESKGTDQESQPLDAKMASRFR